MTWTRSTVTFVAMVITSAVGFVVLESLDVSISLRGGTVCFLMAMVLRVVARDYVQEKLLFGHSWLSWFASSLGIAAVVNLLMWRFWPFWPR